MSEDAREWLEADGLGGFAMGTVDGVRTRRYHGILLAATRPPNARMMLVADLEVFIETSERRYALSSHRYAGDVVYPDGATRRTAFAWQPWPRWEYTCSDDTRIAYELVADHGSPRVALRWTKLAGGAARLIVRPLLAGRDYHSLHHENGAFRFAAEVTGGAVIWRPYEGVPAIACRSNARYEHAPDWYRCFTYSEERARGLDCQEDLASPGVLTFDLAEPAQLVFGTGELDDADAIFNRERARRAPLTPLDRAADQYIVDRGRGRTIIAGYPWFSDWGRDTFIALRGLCLATGRRDVAREILREWTHAVDGGMLPNRFGERNAAPEYNSVDAALWFVIAADAYLADDPGDSVLEAAIAEIVDGYTRGTRHNIGATRDGLLACGASGTQLTWMDAKLGDEVITPRVGKPVEIQALWLNALAIAKRRELFERGRAAFAERFWAGDQLYDVVDVDHVPGAVDASCRPNQLFAIGGLPLQLVDGARARTIVDTVERTLWTPAGPRSLAPGDPRYRGRYVGGPGDRDRVYHNGPVWPWLAGAFVEAWLRVRGNSTEAKREARERFVEPLRRRLEIAGLGHLSEICEGDPPHRAVGCPFQAWSVAELLRLERSVI